ncbi:hypothetical protein [Catellatospora citrea]|uniref:Membrane protein n=1 Tax=Catellatospora citrea TaxID=53366 RepID=A0A8J3KB55_9ACTN|nr:hypothetical protein [Catellatospora citrea]RKE09464.1 hypothetical protein C8E86_4351 [Catellatospora citrea]GIF97424.1 membrane protein [Catellatospora citrea]
MTTTATRPAGAKPRAAIEAKTLRTDRWWLAPVLTVIGLTAWVAYATFRVFMQKLYWVDAYHYLTPFYSPCVSKGCYPAAAEFGRFIPDNPLIPFAALSLPFLLIFRLTCYYYRKAYYRSFWLSPPACAVPDGHAKYTGETRFPLIFQNAHRYAFYAAALISLINTWDAVLAMHSPSGFGFGLGNVILWINVIMLWAYTASCHSCRHIIGGRLKHFSKHPVRYKLWSWVSVLNTRHMGLAWITLATLALTDFYIMGLAAGWWNDLRFIG